MATLKTIVLAVALTCTPITAAHAQGSWEPYVTEASTRFGIPKAWIWRVMAIESSGRATINGRPIRSSKGAMGLMQLMPSTWAAMRAAYGLGTDPDDPHDNIIAGAAYLRLMYDRFGYPGLFGAYNAGPARYQAYLAGRPLAGETKLYLRSAVGADLGDANARRPAVPSPRAVADRSGEPATGRSIFAVRHD